MSFVVVQARPAAGLKDSFKDVTHQVKEKIHKVKNAIIERISPIDALIHEIKTELESANKLALVKEAMSKENMEERMKVFTDFLIEIILRHKQLLDKTIGKGIKNLCHKVGEVFIQVLDTAMKIPALFTLKPVEMALKRPLEHKIESVCDIKLHKIVDALEKKLEEHVST